MKIRVETFTASSCLFGNKAAIKLDISPCSADDILSELWEIYGDELILERVRREGFIVTEKEETK